MKNKVVQVIDKEFALQQYYVNHYDNNIYLVIEDNENDEFIFHKISKATSEEIYRCNLFISIEDKINKEPKPIEEIIADEDNTESSKPILKSDITNTREIRDSKITELYKAGRKIIEIARELNCSDQTVRNTIHRLGLSNPVPRISKGKMDIDLLSHDEFLELYILDNLSLSDISRKYNCTVSHVFKVMNDLGINESKKFYKDWKSKKERKGE